MSEAARTESPGAGVMTCCEPPNLDAENPPCVLWKSHTCSYPLSHLSSPNLGLLNNAPALVTPPQMDLQGSNPLIFVCGVPVKAATGSYVS